MDIVIAKRRRPKMRTSQFTTKPYIGDCSSLLRFFWFPSDSLSTFVAKTFDVCGDIQIPAFVSIIHNCTSVQLVLVSLYKYIWITRAYYRVHCVRSYEAHIGTGTHYTFITKCGEVMEGSITNDVHNKNVENSLQAHAPSSQNVML